MCLTSLILLQSVVRKTVSDDLVENIWDSSHMEKIIPSLLFNMEQGRYDRLEKVQGLQSHT